MKYLCSLEKDGSTTFCKTKQKNGKVKGGDSEAGDVNEEELGEEEKIILVHYEQRKVMLSQLHPTEVPDTDPPSELRPVQKQETDETEEGVTALTLTHNPPGVPDGGAQPASLLPGQI